MSTPTRVIPPVPGISEDPLALQAIYRLLPDVHKIETSSGATVVARTRSLDNVKLPVLVMIHGYPQSYVNSKALRKYRAYGKIMLIRRWQNEHVKILSKWYELERKVSLVQVSLHSRASTRTNSIVHTRCMCNMSILLCIFHLLIIL